MINLTLSGPVSLQTVCLHNNLSFNPTTELRPYNCRDTGNYKFPSPDINVNQVKLRMYVVILYERVNNRLAILESVDCRFF